MFENVTQKCLISLFCEILKYLKLNFANFKAKRDLKGFKCMTVRLDVFGDIPRLFQYFENDANILRKIPILCELF